MCMFAEYSENQKREAVRAAKEEMLAFSKAKRQAFQCIRAMEKNLPTFVIEWAKTLFPRYMFFVKQKRGDYDAYCECCGAKVHLDRAKSARKIACPACNALVTLKDGRRNPNGTGDFAACSYLGRDGDAITQRLFAAHKNTWFTNGSVQTQYFFYEEQRDYRVGKQWIWFHPKAQGKKAGEWTEGPGRMHGEGWRGWRLQDQCIHTYPYNLRGVLHGTNYEYSALDIAAENSLVNPIYYLKFYEQKPKLEILYKIGLYRAAEQIMSDYYNHDAERILSEIRSLKDLGIESRAEAAVCSRMTVEQMIARKEVKCWKIDEESRAAAEKFIEAVNDRSGRDFDYDFITREGMFRYWQTQRTQYAEARDFFADYTDYISICSRLGADLRDTAVKKPKDLKKAHDHAMTEEKVKEQEIYDSLVEAVYEARHAFTEWTDGKLQVIMPRHAREIVEEGVRQHHCVGRYVRRVAAGESIILFIRRANDPTKNFYTLEIKKDMRRCHIVQVRGEHNASATEEVAAFCKKYEEWFNRRKAKVRGADKVMVRYYKAVHKKGEKYVSDWDGKTEYRIGEWIEAETDKDPDKVAVKGLHVASLGFAVKYSEKWKDAAIIEVETNIHDVVIPDADDQVRTRRFRVVREVPAEEIASSRAAANVA